MTYARPVASIKVMEVTPIITVAKSLQSGSFDIVPSS